MTPKEQQERLLQGYNSLQKLRREVRTIHDALHGLEEAEIDLGSQIKACLGDMEAQDQSAPPPIEVEMLVRELGQKALCKGNWIAGPPALLTHSSSLQEGARDHAEKWLAALSKKLGVKLMAKWTVDLTTVES